MPRHVTPNADIVYEREISRVALDWISNYKKKRRKRGKFKSRIIATLRDKLVALKSQLYEESNGYLVVAHLI